MTDDLLAELRELQRYASGLQSLIMAAQASAPGGAEGSDASGTVRATIGADGLPASIRVQDHWQRHLSGERFGAAVLEAFAAASEQRMAAWTEALETNGWQSKVDQMQAELDGPRGAPAPSAPVPPAPELGPDRPRPLNAVAEDMLNAFDRVDELSAASTVNAEGAGSGGYGKFTLRLSQAGLVSCAVDPHWASQQEADALMDAFDEAVAQAKADLSRKATVAGPGPNLDRVLGEALALLNDPQRLAES